MHTPQLKQSISTTVTDRIIKTLEAGTIPWKQPWNANLAPRNLITGRPYRGINIWLLRSLPFGSPHFLSFRQVHNLGGSIKKGEKSCPVVFWKRMETKDSVTGEQKPSFLLRYYNVFNVEQCTDIDHKFIPPIEEITGKAMTKCAKVIKDMRNPPFIQPSINGAYYVPSKDEVCVPSIHQFKDKESYYLTLFHELIHSTGHTSRLNRKEVMENTSFGSETYSLEELTAEMGACFLASHTGILDMHFENNAAYIANWLTVFQGDTRILLRASSQAQRAVDHILGIAPIYSHDTQTVTSEIAA